MTFAFICFIFIITCIVVFIKKGIFYPFSKGIGISIALALLSVICLAQNYTQSLIPEVNDGIGVSNQIAYWLIGEDRWSQDLFRVCFERSIYITFILIIVYPIVLIIESILKRKN